MKGTVALDCSADWELEVGLEMRFRIYLKQNNNNKTTALKKNSKQHCFLRLWPSELGIHLFSRDPPKASSTNLLLFNHFGFKLGVFLLGPPLF